MGCQSLLQFTATLLSPSSIAPLASPSRSAARATTSEKRWTGKCAAVNGSLNPLVNFPVDGSRTLRLLQANGDKRRSQLRVAALFGKEKRAVAVEETVIPDPDYRTSIVLLGATGAFVYSDNLFAAAPVGLLGLLLLVQTTRVKFVFDNDSLEVKIGEDLKGSGDNVFVGGENRWNNVDTLDQFCEYSTDGKLGSIHYTYSSFINWEFWWPNFPVLVYFKESQTKPEGQIHFFPVIFNGKQVYDVMVERCGPSKTSGPK